MHATPGSTLELGWAEIAYLKHLEAEHLLLGLRTPGVEPRPGQYALLADENALLPRPFSYFGFKDEIAEFLIKIRGKFTRRLAGMREGERILWRGPYGRPLPKMDEPVLIAGGVGAAPLRFYKALYGGKLVLGLPSHYPELVKLVNPDVLATEDGSAGVKGTVLEALPEGDIAIACGPEPMLRALTELWPEDKLILVLEGMMACGVGICLGCAVRRRGGGYYRLCKDGPWFWANQIEL